MKGSWLSPIWWCKMQQGTTDKGYLGAPSSSHRTRAWHSDMTGAQWGHTWAGVHQHPSQAAPHLSRCCTHTARDSHSCTTWLLLLCQASCCCCCSCLLAELLGVWLLLLLLLTAAHC
jgi:hypothetical protein